MLTCSNANKVAIINQLVLVGYNTTINSDFILKV